VILAPHMWHATCGGLNETFRPDIEVKFLTNVWNDSRSKEFVACFNVIHSRTWKFLFSASGTRSHKFVGTTHSWGPGPLRPIAGYTYVVYFAKMQPDKHER